MVDFLLDPQLFLGIDLVHARYIYRIRAGYADPVIDWLDAGRGILARRLFRDVSYFKTSCNKI